MKVLQQWTYGAAAARAVRAALRSGRGPRVGLNNGAYPTFWDGLYSVSETEGTLILSLLFFISVVKFDAKADEHESERRKRTYAAGCGGCTRSHALDKGQA